MLLGNFKLSLFLDLFRDGLLFAFSFDSFHDPKMIFVLNFTCFSIFLIMLQTHGCSSNLQSQEKDITEQCTEEA